MGLKESCKERYGDLLKVRADLGSYPKGQTLSNSNLTDKEINSVMLELGSYLGNDLHQHSGEGYGFVEHPPLIFFNRLKSPYKSWPGFLLSYFDNQSDQMLNVRMFEQNNGIQTHLKPETRQTMNMVWGARPKVRQLFEDSKVTLNAVTPQLLHGNLHMGSIYVENGHLDIGDYSQMLLGDPIDDLAYFSVMPGGERYLPTIRSIWEHTPGHDGHARIDERLHLYRLWESLRKIGTRYTNHHNLDKYPEPLEIAQKELKHFSIGF